MLEIALAYIDFGWVPVPIPHREKSPVLEGWQKRRIVTPEDAAQHFNGAPQNIGILLGEASRGLVDVDLDCYETVTLAPVFLPQTSGKFGRASKRASHWLYISDVRKTEQYSDPNGGMLVELRSNGAQTVFPGSTHVSGEFIDFEADADPRSLPTIDRAALSESVRKLAAAALLARYFPRKGRRHDFCLALGGALLKSGWGIEETELFVWAVAWCGGSADPVAKVRDVRGTADKLTAGEVVTGWGTVEELLADVPLGGGKGGAAIVKRVKKILPVRIGALPTLPGAGSILLGPDLHRVVSDTIVALAKDPDIYQRDAKLARMVRVAEAEEAEERTAAGTPQIRHITTATLRERLTLVASFMGFSKASDSYVAKIPPDEVVSAVADRGEWPGIRPIVGVIETPSLRPDGTLIVADGYDAETGYLLAPQRKYPDVPEMPTADELRAAWGVLWEPWREFPWGPLGTAVAVAAVLTLVCRPAVRGAVPAFVFDATARGSGKTLACEAVTMLAHGRASALVTWPETGNEEVEKILASYAWRGANVVVWDNIVGKFGGAALDKVLTAMRVEFRVLGRSEVPNLKWNAVTLANGNNVVLGVDTTRRVLVARLEPMVERPEERTGYRISDLMLWAEENHARTVSAALTVMRGYAAAGRPDMGLPGWGSFESWRDLIGGCIKWGTGIDVTIARPTLSGEDDADMSALRVIVRDWSRAYPEGATAREALERLALQPDLAEAMSTLAGVPVDRLDANRMGQALKRIKGRAVSADGMTLNVVSRQVGPVMKWSIARK